MRQVICFYPVSFETITHGRHAKPAKLEFVSIKQNGAGKIFSTDVIFMCSEIIFLLLVDCKAVFYRNNGCGTCKRLRRRTTSLFWRQFLIFVLQTVEVATLQSMLSDHKKMRKKNRKSLTPGKFGILYFSLYVVKPRPAKISGIPGRGCPLLNIQSSGVNQNKTLNIWPGSLTVKETSSQRFSEITYKSIIITYKSTTHSLPGCPKAGTGHSQLLNQIILVQPQQNSKHLAW